ncbi:TetR/AcrR family transcriptional regulator [Arthrobacter sp. SLBN-112]|uniref:TetR/AcrR family transcriptional regulator n=1 Tax=Arthrobacter sp. SLBN-112 TaxID=2768452 RepID=UPI0027B17684|nr:TetR/AcrR family transcriptional regulator [Arthrobacter sp. SLBN-112]MDQ0799022.1 AcrR family transcriptional regulator [Arthrobacter sp. SLBN-112]
MSRPRTFEETAALRAALQTFWRYGYEGASMELLAEAMGMNKASIYRVFGSKQELFERVREVYHREYLRFRIEALGQRTPKMIATRLLHGMVNLHAEQETPAGCLETNAALAIGPEKERIRAQLAESREALWDLLTERFEDTKDDGGLPPSMSASDAAAIVSTLVQGLAVQAKSGRSKEELTELVNAVLRTWPD